MSVITSLTAAGVGYNALTAIAKSFQDGSVNSLTEYTKDVAINIRMYVDDSLANEDIMADLSAFLNQLCVGYVFTALNMQNYISKSKTVRDLMKVVATEGIRDTIQIINDGFDKSSMDQPVISMEAKVLDLDSRSQKLFTGRVVEVSLNVPGDEEGKTKEVKLVSYVQMVPYILPSNVIKGFLSLNFQLPPNIRRMQAKAGEINFVRDFLLAQDLMKKERDILKEDKTGVLTKMLERKSSAIFKWLTNNIGRIFNPSKEKRANTASSIIIIDKQNFTEVCKDLRINFDNSVTRNKFFAETFAMMFVVVDSMYNVVDLYFCGLDSVGEYSFNNISKAVSGKSSDDNLKDILVSLSRNAAPRY